MAAAPNWVMLECVVSRINKDKSFPDESEAPIRASGMTSLEAPFSVAIKLAEPPKISRLYARLPGFPEGPARHPLFILAAHQHLVLFRVLSVCEELPVQDLFILSASDSSLKLLPHCTLPEFHFHTPCDGRPSGRASPPPLCPPGQRVMSVTSLGLLCQGEGFVVAEADILIRGRSHSKLKHPKLKLYADIFWLESSAWQWKSVRTKIVSRGSTDDFRWHTEAVIPVGNQLCWIDYNNGILFGDMFHKPTPTVTLARFPPEEFPSTDDCWMYRSVSAIDADSRLRFVKVNKTVDGFTITCHTVTLLANDDKVGEWEKDYTVTSRDLWHAKRPEDLPAYISTSRETWSYHSPEDLPHDILMFPQVNIHRPHIVYFLIIGKSMYMKKKDMWVVTLNMEAKEVESYQYINAREVHENEDNSLAEVKSACPLPFLPFESSKFLHL